MVMGGGVGHRGSRLVAWCLGLPIYIFLLRSTWAESSARGLGLGGFMPVGPISSAVESWPASISPGNLQMMPWVRIEKDND
jgi:hypothetical protein